MKTVLRLFIIVVTLVLFLGISATSTGSQVCYAAGAELSHKIASYESDSGYKNATDGVSVRGYFTKDATSLIKVTYTAVVVSFNSDIVEVDSDSGEITLNGTAVTDDYIVGKESKLKDVEVEIKNVANPTDGKTKYVQVVANEWCAIVFAVHYLGTNNEEAVTYNSDVFMCTNIDAGVPDAYRTGVWVKQANAVELEIMIRSDRVGQTRSYDSGINYFVVYKGVSRASEKVEIYRKSGVGSTFYIYKLTMNLQEKAFYQINVVDNAGNNALFDVAENNNIKYDEGFESALKNALTYLESSELYLPSVYENLKNAYYEYYMAIQQEGATEGQKEQAKNKALPYLTEFSRLKQLEQSHQKEYTLKITNSEYVKGEITLANVDIALSNVLYGEKVAIGIALAVFDPHTVERGAEMQVAGIANCEEILSLSLSASKDGIDYKEDFFKPLQISVPLNNYKNIKATMSIPLADGSFDIKVVDIIYYKDYIILNAPHSYGTINLFVNEVIDNSLLWLLTLLIIPLGLAVFATIKIIKNKKKKLEGSYVEPKK